MQAIIFDFYGVISIRAHQDFLDTYLADPKQIQYAHQLRGHHDRGVLSVDDYLEAISRLAGMPKEEISESLRSERILNEHLLSFIFALKPRYKIGMLSNAASDLYAYIDQETLKEVLDDVLISANVGMTKPDPRIFLLACERLGVPPEETIMVDDLKDNCAGARTAGLETVQYESFSQCKAMIEKLLASDSK